MPKTMRARDRGTPMTLLVAGCLWGAHSLVGCAPESIPVGALDADGGEANTGGESAGGPTSGGTRAVAGGRGGTGTGVGGGGRSQAGLGNAAAEGGDPGTAGFPGAGFGGSGAGAGQGGFAGTFAGYAGYAGDGPVAGTFGNSGNAGFAGNAGSGGAGGNAGGGGVFGDAGYGNSGGVFGYAGDAAIGAEVFELGPADEAGCTRAICEGAFEWRTARVADDDYYFTDLSGDGRVLVGYGAQGRGFRMSWDLAEMWMLLFNGREFPAEATSFGGTLLAGGNRWTRDNGPPTIISGIPDAYRAVAASHDGQVVAAVENATGSYVYRHGEADAVPDYLFWAVSADGSTVAGERLADGRAVIGVVQGSEGGIGEIEVLPVHDGWVPRAVNGLSSSGSLAVGYASNADTGSGAQAFRWQRGSEELELLGFPEGTDASIARDCNADCSIVVGFTSVGSTTAGGFVHDSGGMLSVSAYAFERAGLATISGLSVDAIRISLDGTRIAGGGLKDATRIVFHQRFTQTLSPQ